MGIVGAVYDGESTEAQRCGDLAGVIPMSAGPLHCDDRGRLIEAGEQFEQARAALGELIVLLEDGLIQGKTEVYDRYMNRGAGDKFAGLLAGAGAVGDYTHGFEQSGEAIYPGIGSPASVGEEEMKAGIAGTCGMRRSMALAAPAV